MAHLITLFTEPAGDDQPFHLVVPSLSGLGFSDALPDKLPVIPSVARMLDVVMKRLGYHHFLVSSSGPSPSALPPVDSRVANHLALHHPDSCLGVHLVSPPLGPPRMRDSVVAWARWKSASILRSPMLGYSREDVEASTNGDGSAPLGTRASSAAVPGFGSGGACEPNILAYALCDSLLATLLFFVMIFRMSGSNRDLPPEDIIKITQLTWLPGPEGTMRLWARCASGQEEHKVRRGRRPRAAITVFLGDGDQPPSMVGSPGPSSNAYACPAWGCLQYQVVACNRVKGRAGLVALERPHVIAEGVRKLAKAVLVADGRLKTPRPPHRPGLTQREEAGSRRKAAAATETATASGEAAEHIRRQTEGSEAEPSGQQAAGPSRRAAWTEPMGGLTPRGLGEGAEERQRSPGGGGISQAGSPDTVIAVPRPA